MWRWFIFSSISKTFSVFFSTFFFICIYIFINIIEAIGASESNRIYCRIFSPLENLCFLESADTCMLYQQLIHALKIHVFHKMAFIHTFYTGLIHHFSYFRLISISCCMNTLSWFFFFSFFLNTLIYFHFFVFAVLIIFFRSILVVGSSSVVYG